MKKSIFALSALTIILAGCNDNAEKADTAAADQQPVAGSVQQNSEPAATGDMTTSVEGSAPTAVDPLQQKTADLDWQGTYQGSLLGTDGKPVDTTITLNVDQSFTMTQTVKGKEQKSEGKFAWDPEGTKLTLDDGQGKPAQYAIEDNTLIKLDAAGNRVAGDMASQYLLHKQ